MQIPNNDDCLLSLYFYYCRTLLKSFVWTRWKSDLKVTQQLKQAQILGKMKITYLRQNIKFSVLPNFFSLVQTLILETSKAKRWVTTSWAIISTSLILCYHVWVVTDNLTSLVKTIIFQFKYPTVFVNFYQQESNWGASMSEQGTIFVFVRQNIWKKQN